MRQRIKNYHRSIFLHEYLSYIKSHKFGLEIQENYFIALFAVPNHNF